MENQKDYSCDTFIEQQKLQAELQLWKVGLGKLAAEFDNLDNGDCSRRDNLLSQFDKEEP